MPGSGLPRENTILLPSGENETSNALVGEDPSAAFGVISASRFPSGLTR